MSMPGCVLCPCLGVYIYHSICPCLGVFYVYAWVCLFIIAYVHAWVFCYVHAWVCLFIIVYKKLPPTNHAIDYLAGWWGE